MHFIRSDFSKETFYKANLYEWKKGEIKNFRQKYLNRLIAPPNTFHPWHFPSCIEPIEFAWTIGRVAVLSVSMRLAGSIHLYRCVWYFYCVFLSLHDGRGESALVHRIQIHLHMEWKYETEYKSQDKHMVTIHVIMVI